MAKSNFIVRGGADFSDIDKQMKALQKLLKTAGKDLQEAGKKLTAAITLPVIGAGAAAFKFAADMQDAMGATDQIYGTASNSVKDWAKNLETYYGIANSEALEYANMMGSMLQNIGGLTEDQAAKQAQSLIELAGDLTAMYGGTTQDAVQALTGALKGNNTMLDNYGMAVNDAMIKTKAFEMGIYSGKGEMDLATKQAATLALITEQTGAAQGQAAREADGASGSMRAMTTELKNLATSFGQILLPIITPFITKINEMVQKFDSLDEETKKNIVTLALVAAAIGPVLLVVGKLTSGINTVIGVVTAVKTALGAGAGLSGVLTAIAGPAGPVLAVIAVIGALIAIGVLLYKNWDEIKAKAIEIWDSIKVKISGIVEGLKTSIKGSINGAIGIVNKFINFWNGIKIEVPKVKIPLVGTVGGFTVGVPYINEIPMLANGGIVNKPTLAMIGEAGPEAVIPLNGNTDFGPKEIVINLDGTRMARVLIPRLNNESERLGYKPILRTEG